MATERAFIALVGSDFDQGSDPKTFDPVVKAADVGQAREKFLALLGSMGLDANTRVRFLPVVTAGAF